MLGLLVNGMTVYGRTESPRAVFAELDAENARMIERARATNAGDANGERVEKIEDTLTRTFEEDQCERNELMARTESQELDEMTEDDIRAVIDNRTTTLTLADAHVFPPGGQRFEVPLMRVRIAQVAAWWLLPSDAEGKATITHPTA